MPDPIPTTILPGDQFVVTNDPMDRSDEVAVLVFKTERSYRFLTSGGASILHTPTMMQINPYGFVPITPDDPRYIPALKHHAEAVTMILGGGK